jgi:hypothetical protein
MKSKIDANVLIVAVVAIVAIIAITVFLRSDLKFTSDTSEEETEDNIAGEAVATKAKVLFPEIKSFILCSETDGGINYDKQGGLSAQALLANGTKTWNSVSDSCLAKNSGNPRINPVEEGDYVGEVFCNGKIPSYTVYKCRNGCFKGACKEVVTPNINKTCVDSDGGVNYNLAGYCKDSTGTYPDRCLSSIGIIDYFCRNDNLCGGDITNCQYGCENGACLKTKKKTIL